MTERLGSAQTGIVREHEAPRATLVLRDVRDENGSSRREVRLSDDGGLAILGHDLGRGAEGIFGENDEYEFQRRLSPTETRALRRLLGVATDGDLLDAIESRFTSTNDLETFLVESALPGEFWNRIGR